MNKNGVNISKLDSYKSKLDSYISKLDTAKFLFKTFGFMSRLENLMFKLDGFLLERQFNTYLNFKKCNADNFLIKPLWPR